MVRKNIYNTIGINLNKFPLFVQMRGNNVYFLFSAYLLVNLLMEVIVRSWEILARAAAAITVAQYSAHHLTPRIESSQPHYLYEAVRREASRDRRENFNHCAVAKNILPFVYHARSVVPTKLHK